MIVDLGTVTPGSTLRVFFDSYSGTDGSSITMTNFAVGDILIYKDGSTTERASTSGYTATTDFDSKTGKQFVAIDLADNTTAGFYSAGSEYLVAIDTVTIDGAATGGSLARFKIGYEGASLNTTIATLSSQTSFTLTNGPAEDDALNGRWAIIHDVASSVQCTWVQILDYTGSTKTVTLAAAGTYTAAATDNFSLMGPMPIQATVIGRTLDVTATGAAGIDWGNVENPTTTVGLTNTTISTTQAVASVSGAVGSVTGAVGSVTGNVGGNVTGSVGSLASQAQTDVRTAVGLASANLDDQLGGLTVASAAINTVAESYTLTTGTQSSGTFSSTQALDGTEHQHTDTAGAMELYYQFDVGNSGIPVSVTVTGRLVGSNDSLGIYAYNWAGTSWTQVGTLAGSASTTNGVNAFTLLTSHVGTGSNVGKVRVRFYAASGLTSATLYVDQIYVSYAQATTGIANGSTITLSAATTNANLIGNGWALALGGQNIGGTRIAGASNGVSGTATGANPFFYECSIGTATLPPCALQTCGLSSTLTIGSGGDFFLVDCFSQVAGTGTPTININSVASVNLTIRRWSGGLTISGIVSTTIISLDAISGGTITLNGADGNVQVRGMVNIVDNRTGSPTLGTTNNMDARLDTIDAAIAAVKSDSAAILLDTGTDGVIVVTNNDKTNYRLGATGVSDIGTAILTTALTESYAADGAAPTLAQAIFAIQQMMQERSISSTTMTIKKLDGSTTAMTLTLNDATNPTSITRAS